MLAFICRLQQQMRCLQVQAVRFPLMAAQQLCEVGQHPLASSLPSLQVRTCCFWPHPRLALHLTLYFAYL